MDEKGDKFVIGVESIDDDHKALFSAVEDLKSAMDGKAEAREMGALLHRLAEATGKHFASEESLMREAKYPGLALHQANHQRLMEKLHAFVARHGRSGAQLDHYALNFLRDWLVFHVENDDQRLGDWLRDRARDLARAQSQAQGAVQSA